MSDQNKELDDFYSKVNFGEYEDDTVTADNNTTTLQKVNVDDLDSLTKAMDSVKIRSKVFKFFKNCGSLDDKIRFVNYKGYLQPMHYNKKDKLMTPYLLVPNNNCDSRGFDKNLFKNDIKEMKVKFEKSKKQITNCNLNNAFKSSTRLTIKIGNQYNFSDEPNFDWTSEYKISQFKELYSLKSSFTDHTEIIKNDFLTSSIAKTKFKGPEINVSFKLILINKDGLFKSIFGRILNDVNVDDNDKNIAKVIIDSKSIELKVNSNCKVERISIVEHPEYGTSSSNFDVINDKTSDHVHSSDIGNILNLNFYSWGSYKYDTRFQIKQDLIIEESTYTKFKLLQDRIGTIMKSNKRGQLLLKCKRNQFRYLREKYITTYRYTYCSDNLKDFCISLNIINYVEYYSDKRYKSDDEICLRPSNQSFSSLSITSSLDDILQSANSDLKFNEIIENSWDLGQWLPRIASSCI